MIAEETLAIYCNISDRCFRELTVILFMVMFVHTILCGNDHAILRDTPGASAHMLTLHILVQKSILDHR